jgi:cytochrome c oxidase subunit 1
MSTLAVHDHGVVHHEEGHEHHHKATFLNTYVFSQDHKYIAKQFLITGITMAFIAMTLSILFRIQLAYPDKSFPLLETLLGRFAPGGRLSPDFYLALVTIHGTIMVFFVLTAGLSGTFANLLIP